MDYSHTKYGGTMMPDKLVKKMLEDGYILHYKNVDDLTFSMVIQDTLENTVEEMTESDDVDATNGDLISIIQLCYELLELNGLDKEAVDKRLREKLEEMGRYDSRYFVTDFYKKKEER